MNNSETYREQRKPKGLSIVNNSETYREQRKPKGQSIVNNSETQGALFIRPTKTNKAKNATHKNKNVSNTDPNILFNIISVSYVLRHFVLSSCKILDARKSKSVCIQEKIKFNKWQVRIRK